MVDSSGLSLVTWSVRKVSGGVASTVYSSALSPVALRSGWRHNSPTSRVERRRLGSPWCSRNAVPSRQCTDTKYHQMCLKLNVRRVVSVQMNSCICQVCTETALVD